MCRRSNNNLQYFLLGIFVAMKTRKNLHEIAFASWAIEWVVLAKEYCKMLEDSVNEKENTRAKPELKKWLFDFLGLLFYKTARLPNLQAVVDYNMLDTRLDEQQYQYICKRVEEELGASDPIAFRLDEIEAELYQGEPHLSEIVADIYQELYELLIQYQDGEEERMAMALARCQYYFLTEWGSKLLLALRWLQSLHCDEYLPDEDV